MAGSGTPEDEICASCLASPLEISLVLKCEHRLCVRCAASQLHWPRHNDPRAVCPQCGSVTEVDHSAAQHICDVPDKLNSSIDEVGVPQAPQDTTAAHDNLVASQHHHEHSRTQPRRSSTSSISPRLDLQSMVEAAATRLATAAKQGFSPREGTATVPATGLGGGGGGRPMPRQLPGVPSAALPLCGQCEAFPAELFCQQCNEQFCSQCSTTMHRAGRMREHSQTLLANAGSRPPAAASVRGIVNSDLRSSLDSCGATSSADITTCGACTVHPEEPLQFFCLDCEVEPFCAECVVHRGSAHHGHRVMKLRDAFHNLMASDELTRMEQAGRERAEELEQVGRRTEVQRQELKILINEGTQRITGAFQRLKVTLSQKEAQILARAEDCVQAVDEALACRMERLEEHAGEAWDSHTMLTNFDSRGDEVKAINTFAGARITVTRLLEHMDDVDGGGLQHLLGGLNVQVQQVLRDQEAALTALNARMPDIRRGGSTNRGNSNAGSASVAASANADCF